MKRIPPWALIAGAVAIGALIWLLRKRKQQLEEQAAQESGSESPVIAGVENPAEEYPYTITGVGGGGGGALGNAAESQAEFAEFMRTQQQYQGEFQQEEREFQTGIANTLRENQEALTRTLKEGGGTTGQGSGGGAPTEPRPGVTPAPPQGGGGSPSCPSSFPNKGPHGCYHDGKCGNGCTGHFYQNGTKECQHKDSKGRCVW